MKPYLKCSATFMQFQGNSTYNKQFVKKKNKNYSPIKREDKKKKNDVLYLSTTNQKQFMKKNMLNSKVNFKPRNSTAATGLLFKGSTEYQG